MQRFLNWLDARTDYRRLLEPVRRRVLPNGPGWSYSTASCLFWLFIIQLATGLLLMLSYSPSTTTAWASVHFIEQSAYGRFLRGLHHYTSHALIILCVVHIVRVLLSRAFQAPRELLWVTGLLMVPLLLVWAISGNPLSGGMKGVAQIEVEGHIIGSTPIIGPIIQRVLIGGDEVGHLTLTHLYFLHVGLLPLLMIGLLTVHLTQVFRHGLSVAELGGPQDDVSHFSSPNLSARLAANADAGPSAPRLKYFPYQTVRNMIALTVILGILAGLAIWYGAPLDAPADPTLPQTPRPEWYFRSLFELRRYFTGDWEFVATMLIPAAVLGFFVFFPMLDRKCSPRGSAVLRTLVVLLGVGAWGGLTALSYLRDWKDADYLASSRATEAISARARELADRAPLPPEGAAALLRNDPKTQGPWLFARHCAECHAHTDPNGLGIAASEPSAPNLYGFATPEWISGMLDPNRIVSEHFFGQTKFAEGEMVSKIQELFDGLDEAEAAKMRDELKLVAQALSAEAALPRSAAADHDAQAPIAAGRELLTGKLACTDCHKFGDKGALGSAPDLTGYGSREWLLGMIANPQHDRFYPGDRNDRMPAFAEDTEHPERNLLSPRELQLLVDWLRGDWYEPPPGGKSENRSSKPELLATPWHGNASHKHVVSNGPTGRTATP
jgi:ubiquinol-cytochrome c reductase cytochrome b subunit